MDESKVIKVSSRSVSKNVAGKIVATFKEDEIVHISAIGAGAVNQAVKAMAIAREFSIADERNLVVLPFFKKVVIDGEDIVAMSFVMVDR